jgi:hypothetical protein
MAIKDGFDPDAATADLTRKLLWDNMSQRSRMGTRLKIARSTVAGVGDHIDRLIMRGLNEGKAPCTVPPPPHRPNR